MVCLFLVSVYGTRKVGCIREIAIHSEFINFGFHATPFDTIIYFFQRNSSFLILLTVFDDISFATNYTVILNKIKARLVVKQLYLVVLQIEKVPSMEYYNST